MIKRDSSVWDEKQPNQLAKILGCITNEQTMRDFLRDVLTEKEIIEIAARFEAAKLLSEGKKYTEIIQKTKLSSRTIARISEWLQSGCEGYSKAIEIANEHHIHIPPARV